MSELPIPHTINLSHLPAEVRHSIQNTLRNPACTSDHVLLLADCLAESCDHMSLFSPYLQAYKNVERALRTLAPAFAEGTNAVAP